MFENIMRFFRKVVKKQEQESNSKSTAKERLHLVLMQDRANVSADFLELMKQEIIEVIKKYIDVDESAIDVRLTNKENEDGTNGAPALYANIPIINIKDEVRKNSTVKTSENDNKKVNQNKKEDNQSNKKSIDNNSVSKNETNNEKDTKGLNNDSEKIVQEVNEEETKLKENETIVEEHDDEKKENEEQFEENKEELNKENKQDEINKEETKNIQN